MAWIKIVLRNQFERPIAGARYCIEAADGTALEGRLDAKGQARLDSIAPGPCHVRFPDLDAEAESSGNGSSAANATFPVGKADHLAAIAERHDFPDPSALWRGNPELSAKRRNPFMLFGGDAASAPDQVRIPARRARREPCVVDAENVFVVDQPELELRLRILDADFRPAAGRGYRFEAHPHDSAGIIGPAGEIVAKIGPSAERATLWVEPPPGGPAQPGNLVQIVIGGLNPILEEAPDTRCVSGVQARLHNLGIDCGPIDGILGPLTENAIRAFQRISAIPESGAPDAATQQRLRAAHDQAAADSGPAAPPRSGDGAAADGRREIADAASAIRSVAFAAPDAAPGHSLHAGHWNTIALRCAYRLRLRLGDIDALFPTDIGDPTAAGVGGFAGRKMRLQAVGLLDILLSRPASEAAYQAAWKRFRTHNRARALADDYADAELLDRLPRAVIDNGELPSPGRFARIRLPGGLAHDSRFDHPLHEPDYQDATALRSRRFVAEERLWGDNPALGRLPIIAKAEKLAADGAWIPAPGVQVRFELITPDAPPSFDPSTPPQAQPSAPPPAGPAAAQLAAMRGESAGGGLRPDPQAGNALHRFGGKRGAPVAGNVFAIDQVQGFNQPHRRRKLPHLPLPVAKPLDEEGGSPRYGVRAGTNAEGEAGALFLPSRVAGDRYRLRAVIPGDDLLDAEWRGDPASAETGTMTVWRTLRISRYLRLSPPSRLAPELAAELAAPPFGLSSERTLGHEQLAGGLGAIDFKALALELAKAHIELALEPGADRPEEIRQRESEWKAAFKRALERSVAACRQGVVPYDVERLFSFEPDSPFLFNIRTPQAYNRLLDRAGEPPASPRRIRTGPGGGASCEDRERVWELLHAIWLPEFMGGFNESGGLPGLTIIQAPYGCSWQFLGLAPPGKNLTGCGEPTRMRGFYVFLGEQFHRTAMPWGVTSSALRQLGRTLFLPEAAGPGAESPEPARHGRGGCVMGFEPGATGFCACCLADLMGLAPGAERMAAAQESAVPDLGGAFTL